MPFRLTLDNEPIVLIEVSGELADDELRGMTETVTQVLCTQRRNAVRTAVVLDFSSAGPIAPRQRKMIGQWRREVRELTRHVCVGMAMVVNSPFVRGILTAIGWFSPEPVPVVYLESVAAGVAWAIESCEAAGIDVPLHVKQNLTKNSGFSPRRAASGNGATPRPGLHKGPTRADARPNR